MSIILLFMKRRTLISAFIGLVLLLTCIATSLALDGATGPGASAEVNASNAAATSMMDMEEITLPHGTATAFRVTAANGAPFAIFVRAPKGLIVCGTFDLEALEARGVAAASVKGIKTIEEALATQVNGVTQQARDLGIEPDMPVEEALAKLI